MSLLFNILSRFVITFPPRIKCLLISWLHSLSIVILEPKKIKSVTIFTFFPFICHEVIGLDAMMIVFWIWSFKPAFSCSFFTFIKRLFTSSLSAIRVVSSAYVRLLIFLPAILIPACASSRPAFCMIQKMKVMASGPISSWEIDEETVETVSDFIKNGSKITADGDCSHEIKRCLLLGRKVMT